MEEEHRCRALPIKHRFPWKLRDSPVGTVFYEVLGVLYFFFWFYRFTLFHLRLPKTHPWMKSTHAHNTGGKKRFSLILRGNLNFHLITLQDVPPLSDHRTDINARHDVRHQAHVITSFCSPSESDEQLSPSSCSSFPTWQYAHWQRRLFSQQHAGWESGFNWSSWLSCDREEKSEWAGELSQDGLLYCFLDSSLLWTVLRKCSWFGFNVFWGSGMYSASHERPLHRRIVAKWQM